MTTTEGQGMDPFEAFMAQVQEDRRNGVRLFQPTTPEQERWERVGEELRDNR